MRTSNIKGGAQRIIAIIIVMANSGQIPALKSSRLPMDDVCEPVVLNGKEVSRKSTYRLDQTRSFGKPGNTSYRVQKKTCATDDKKGTLEAFPRQPHDCGDIQARGMNTSGVYAIYPGGSGYPVNVFCDMVTDGGGWTVFQRRTDGSIDFARNWKRYKHGFGSVSSEHWLGNEKMHRLVSQTAYELRIDLEDFEGGKIHATYSSFNLSSEDENYRISVAGYSGDADDCLKHHNDAAFSTPDRDNDAWWGKCAQKFNAGWWFTYCRRCNLNGVYDSASYFQPHHNPGLIWKAYRSNEFALKGSEMKIRSIIPKTLTEF